MVPSRPAFIIKTAAPQEQAAQVLNKLHIVGARFHVQFKKMSKDIAVSHVKTVEGLKYQRRLTKVLIKTQHIPQGVPIISIENLFNGKRPDRVALAMVNNAARKRSSKANPFHFQNFRLNYMSMLVN